MIFIIRCLFLFALGTIPSRQVDHNYVLIFTSKNCSPCIVTADEFFKKNKINYQLINLYENKAEKKYTDETISNYCKTAKTKKTKSIKDKFVFGKYVFLAKEGGPFVIKYSKTDTVIFNSLNIEEIN